MNFYNNHRDNRFISAIAIFVLGLQLCSGCSQSPSSSDPTDGTQTTDGGSQAGASGETSGDASSTPEHLTLLKTINSHTDNSILGISSIKSLGVTSDGSTAIVLGTDAQSMHEVRVWDLESGERLFAYTPSDVFGVSREVAVSPTAKHYARFAEGNKIEIRDLIKDELLKTVQLPERGNGTALAFSPDGKSIAVRFNIAQVGVWDIESQERLVEWQFSAPNDVKFTHDGKHVVAMNINMKEVHFNDIAAGQSTTKVQTDKLFHREFAISPNGKQIAAVLGPRDEEPISIYNTETGEVEATISGRLTRSSDIPMTFTNDGRLLLTSFVNETNPQDSSVAFWDAKTGKLVYSHGGHQNGVVDFAITSSGDTLVTAAGSGHIRVWKMADALTKPTLGG